MRRTAPRTVAGLLVGLAGAAGAQSRAVRTEAAIRLDGVPDEAVWRLADSIADFTQSEPLEGRPATERTVVRLLRTARGLYVGVWAYDSLPERIRHSQLRRDSDLESDDVVTVMLDPLRDRRSGYLFSVNPNGALSDAEILNFQNRNADWDGVWDARARRGPEGWTAELFIPWQTLRYRPDQDVWGVNIDRLIRRKNEDVLWRGWKRTEGLLFLPAAGAVSGFAGLPPRVIAEFRPYVGGSAAFAPGHVETGKGGLDAKIAPAATLTLDLTANTDFSQVEVDQQVVNLTRFPVFFPEKRPFFLESSGIFDFGQTDRLSAFYSRRIGIDSSTGGPVPLIAGARLTGRLGRDRIGLLAVRTGGGQDAMDLVARVKHDVLTQGYVGAILTGQTGPGVAGDRLTGGADFTLPFVVHDQNLVFGGFLMQSRDSAGAPAATGWRAYVDFPNDLTDDFIGVTRVTPGFDPALGFVNETDILRHTGHIDVFPRPHHLLGLRKLHFKPIEWEVVTHLDGSRSHSSFETTVLGGEFHSGDMFEVNLQRFEDVRDTSDNTLFRDDTVPAGRYWYNRAALDVMTSSGRPVGVGLSLSAGDYYTGTNTAVEIGLVLRTAPHLITELDASQEDVRLGAQHFRARVARVRFDAAASPRLGGTLFLQYDNESDRLTVNTRLHWTPSPGSDAYLVWNTGWPTTGPGGGGVPWRRPTQGALVGKLVYYFRL
jgi:uncharacterized protein DUF5916